MAPPNESRAPQKPVSISAQAAAKETNLSARLIKVAEEERKRLARELHDDIGQRLSLLAVSLDIVKNETRTNDPIREKLEGSLRELQELAEDVHNLSHRLHCSKLQHLGLPAALKEVCRQIGGQHRLEIDLRTTEPCPTLSDDVSLCFYRVAQEALNNAVKHSRSERVKVRLDSSQDRVRLQIRDFGVGFDPAIQADGLGLATMHERLRMVGGTLSIKSSAGKGTELRAEAGIRSEGLVSSINQFGDGSRASKRSSSTTPDCAKRNTEEIRALHESSSDQRDRLRHTLQEMTT